MNRGTDRQTDRRTDGGTDRQTDRQTDTQKEKCLNRVIQGNGDIVAVRKLFGKNFRQSWTDGPTDRRTLDTPIEMRGRK